MNWKNGKRKEYRGFTKDIKRLLRKKVKKSNISSKKSCFRTEKPMVSYMILIIPALLDQFN